MNSRNPYLRLGVRGYSKGETALAGVLEASCGFVLANCSRKWSDRSVDIGALVSGARLNQREGEVLTVQVLTPVYVRYGPKC